jgi:hypothetical protein
MVVDVSVDGTVPTAAYLPVKKQARIAIGLARRRLLFAHCVTEKRTSTSGAHWFGSSVIVGKQHRLAALGFEAGLQTIRRQK